MQLGSKLVTAYTNDEEGVWFPPVPSHASLRWNAAPLARFTKASLFLNPFQRSQAKDRAGALCFTERGKYMDFMHLPCTTGSSLLGPGRPALQDGDTVEELARGNVPLARLDAKPRCMTDDHWVAFAGLRAFPCLQIRSLSAGLAQDTFCLDRPEVRSHSFGDGGQCI